MTLICQRCGVAPRRNSRASLCEQCRRRHELESAAERQRRYYQRHRSQLQAKGRVRVNEWRQTHLVEDYQRCRRWKANNLERAREMAWLYSIRARYGRTLDDDIVALMKAARTLRNEVYPTRWRRLNA